MDYGKIMCQRVQDIQPSGIRKYFDLLQGMEGGISLGIGEPDLPTPWHIRDAGIFSLEKGFTKYTPNAGLSDVRAGISRYLKRRFDLEYAPVGQILVTVGGSEGLDLAFRCLLEPGDEVIIPAPSFVCYGPLVSMMHGVPVTVETKAENDFRLTPDELRAAITPRTKVLVLPFPNNP
ncbi:MAG: aminotransferase class I/II-fold pyridoxal phosphate-dependent enzyme, partial [Oscillospiraceae bacterium]|nr:aminotransferase class I/II-fold pyridoxal phosphate-dependent enzyme [Oscillospiraceae bacterium]